MSSLGCSGALEIDFNRLHGSDTWHFLCDLLVLFIIRVRHLHCSWQHVDAFSISNCSNRYNGEQRHCFVGYPYFGIVQNQSCISMNRPRIYGQIRSRVRWLSSRNKSLPPHSNCNIMGASAAWNSCNRELLQRLSLVILYPPLCWCLCVCSFYWFFFMFDSFVLFRYIRFCYLRSLRFIVTAIVNIQFSFSPETFVNRGTLECYNEL